MNKRERIEAVLRHKRVDRIPWTIFKSLTPWGEAELKFRNNNLSLCYYHFPICKVIRPNVEISEETKFMFDKERGKEIIVRIFATPRGEISYEQRFEIESPFSPGERIRRFDGSEIDQLSASWITKYPFSETTDYEILDFILEDTVYQPNYEYYEKTDQLIGSEGVVMANVGKSPFQSILYELMGPEKCFFEFHDHPKRFQDLYEHLFEKQKEKYKIAADSPAMIIWCPDNITDTITSPTFFMKFCLPFYNEMADLLHDKDKVFVVHMDGQLRLLTGPIAKTRIDVIEAFTPPPMGNLSVDEAKAAWEGKVIWCNFPEVLIAVSDAKAIENYTIKLLKSAAPGDNFILGCTENFPLGRWKETFGAIAKALEKHGRYPIP